jgi:hypothetical protein
MINDQAFHIITWHTTSRYWAASLILLLEIHDCCQGLIHEAAQYLLWWRIRDVVFDGGMPGYYMESLVVDHSE